MLKATLVWEVAVAGLVLIANVSASGYPPKGHAWSKRALLDSIIRQQAISLDLASPEKGCAQALGGTPPSHLTLGEYVAFLVASLDSSNGKSGATASCRPAGKAHVQRCELFFETGIGTDDPWRYGLRFEIDDSGKIDPAKISCPGAS